MAGLNFEALGNLHNSANELLHSPMIQQALVRNSQEKWVHEVSEASLRLLDVCSSSKDVVSLVEEHLHDLQFTLRKVTASGEADIGNKMTAYNCYRNKLKKETLKCLDSLKGSRSTKNNKPFPIVSSEHCPVYVDHNLTLVMDVLTQVRDTTVSIVENLLSLISIPWLDQKQTSITSFKFMSKFMCAKGQRVHDLCDETALQSANKRLDAVEIAIQDLQVEMECMFRRLIHTRVALLNILTN